MLKATENKIAVILLNLGGPDALSNVKPFLFNLFYDKAIITLPNPFRWMIAKLISSRREKIAQDIYSRIGGSSPIIKETEKQLGALKKKLDSKIYGQDIKLFIAMRHWHPMSDEVAFKVKEYNPDKIILLPLYPQFSTTTTGSSVTDLTEAFKRHKVNAELKNICCYFDNDDFISAHAELILKSISELKSKDFRLLFSAHGLPKKTIESGDPYQWQIEQTVALVVKKLNIKNLDYRITYQSRVGPLEWIGPNTEEEIKEACQEQKALVVCPIAFVSEHVETLVELDIEYSEIAKEHKIEYIRVPTLGVNEKFIEALADLVIKEVVGEVFMKKCPEAFCKCVGE
jgi:ferrochelatase